MNLPSRLLCPFVFTIAMAACPATASSIFTPSGPVSLSAPDSIANPVDVVFATVGPADFPPGPINCVLFSCPADTVDILALSLSVDSIELSASLGELVVHVSGLSFSDLRGVGSVADVDPVTRTPTSATAAADGTVTFIFDPGIQGPPDVPVGLSETLFISYAAGSLEPGSQLVTLTIRRAAVNPPFGSSVSTTMVPEPSTSLLVAVGLVGLAGRRQSGVH